MEAGISGAILVALLLMLIINNNYINHHTTDWMCRTYCNPAPLDGSAPNLVIEAETKDGEKYLK